MDKISKFLPNLKAYISQQRQSLNWICFDLNRNSFSKNFLRYLSSYSKNYGRGSMFTVICMSVVFWKSLGLSFYGEYESKMIFVRKGIVAMALDQYLGALAPFKLLNQGYLNFYQLFYCSLALTLICTCLLTLDFLLLQIRKEVKLLRRTCFLIRVLYYPIFYYFILENTFLVFSCQGNFKSLEGFDLTCKTGEKAGMIFAAFLIIILNSFMGQFLNLRTNNIINSNDKYARFDSTFELYFSTFLTINTVVNVLASPKEKYGLLAILILNMVTYCWLANYIRKHPTFKWDFVNDYYFVFCLSMSFRLVLRILAILAYTSSYTMQNFEVYSLILITPILIKFALNYSKKYRNMLFTQLEANFENPIQLLKKINLILRSLKTFKLSTFSETIDYHELLLKGLYRDHTDRCPATTCFCKKYTFPLNSTMDKGTCLEFGISLVQELYHRGIEKFSEKNAPILIFYSLFNLKTAHNLIISYMTLHPLRNRFEFFSEETVQCEALSCLVLEKINAKTGEKFQDRLFSSILQEKNHKPEENRKLALNNILFIDSLEDELFKKINESIDVLIKFWNELYQSKPEMGKIQYFSNEIYENIKYIKLIQESIKLSENNRVTEKYRCLVNIFYFYVANEPKLAFENSDYFNLGLGNLNRKKELRSPFYRMESLVAIRLSLKEGKIGHIISISKNCFCLFQKKADSLIGQPFETLLPKSLGESHQYFLRNLLKGGEQTNLAIVSEKSDYCIDKLGSCFASKFSYYFDFNENNGFHLLVSIEKVVNDNKDYIITDKYGKIDCASSRLKAQIPSLEDKSVFDFCPALEIVYKSINRSSKARAGRPHSPKKSASLSKKKNFTSFEECLLDSNELEPFLNGEGKVLNFSSHSHLNASHSNHTVRSEHFNQQTIKTFDSSEREYLVNLMDRSISSDGGFIRILILKPSNNTVKFESDNVFKPALSQSQTPINEQYIPDTNSQRTKSNNGKSKFFLETPSNLLGEIISRKKSNSGSSEAEAESDENANVNDSIEKKSRRQPDVLVSGMKQKYAKLGPNLHLNNDLNNLKPINKDSVFDELEGLDKQLIDEEDKSKKRRAQIKKTRPVESNESLNEDVDDYTSELTLKNLVREGIMANVKSLDDLSNINEKTSQSSAKNYFRFYEEIQKLISRRNFPRSLFFFKYSVIVYSVAFIIFIIINYFTTKRVLDNLKTYDETLNYLDYTTYNLVEAVRILSIIEGQVIENVIPKTIYLRYGVPDAAYLNSQLLLDSAPYFYTNMTKFDKILTSADINFPTSTEAEILMLRINLNDQKVYEKYTLSMALKQIDICFRIIIAASTTSSLGSISDDLFDMVTDNIPNNILIQLESMSAEIRQRLKFLIDKDYTTIVVIFALNLANVFISCVSFFHGFMKQRKVREELCSLLITVEDSLIEKKLLTLHTLKNELNKIRNKHKGKDASKGKTLSYFMEQMLNRKALQKKRNKITRGLFTKQMSFNGFHLSVWRFFIILIFLIACPLFTCVAYDFSRFKNFFNTQVNSFNRISVLSSDKLLQKTVAITYVRMILTNSKAEIRNKNIEDEMLTGIEEIGKYGVYYDSFLKEGEMDPDFLFFISDNSCQTFPLFCQLNFGITNKGFFEIRGIKINLLKRSFALWIDQNRSPEVAQYLIESDVFLNLLHIDYYENFVMEWLLVALRKKFVKAIDEEVKLYPKFLCIYIFVLAGVSFLAYNLVYTKVEEKYLSTKFTLSLIDIDYIIKNKVIIAYLKKQAKNKALFNKISK